TARVRRYLRHRRLSDVEGLIEMRGPIDATATVMSALEPIEAELFDQARQRAHDSGREEPAALAFDAMRQMADESAAAAETSGGRRAPATIVMRVDKTAFDRGHTEPDEVCEIVGVGPFPVEVARRLCGDVILKALITDGTNVLSVSHLSRVIPVRLRTALEELQPECVIAGCHVDRHLEIDHNVPVEEHGPTALWNLNRVCHHHHRIKTTQDLRIEGEGTHKQLVPRQDHSAGPAPP
ncbi:MAG: HNH endonuclease signature motif containing protein, partial [Acidimicrobiia bacterium]